MTKLQIIQSISDNYHALSPECKEECARFSKILPLKKGAILVKEGQYADKTYYIAQGNARAYSLKKGRDITDWFAFDNEFISPIQSFFLNVPSPMYLETMGPAILLEMDRATIDRLSDKYRDFDRLTKLILTKTLLKLQHRIAFMQFETAQQKYESLLATQSDITQRVPLTHIASYIGITLETLSRVRARKNRI